MCFVYVYMYMYVVFVCLCSMAESSTNLNSDGGHSVTRQMECDRTVFNNVNSYNNYYTNNYYYNTYNILMAPETRTSNVILVLVCYMVGLMLFIGIIYMKLSNRQNTENINQQTIITVRGSGSTRQMEYRLSGVHAFFNFELINVDIVVPMSPALYLLILVYFIYNFIYKTYMNE